MRRFQVVYAVAAVVVAGGIFISCQKKSSGPTAPTAPSRNVLLSDGFEYGNDSLYNLYNFVTWAGGRARMSTTTDSAHWGTHSLTSDSAKTGIRPYMSFTIQDSIAGLEFYFLAKKAEHIPFFAGIGSSGSEWNGLQTILGIGTTASDSLQYIYEWQANQPENQHVCFAALEYDKWYKFRVECNFNDTTVNYYMNDSGIQTIKTTDTLGNIRILQINRFFVMRDSLGQQGPGPGGAAQYYFDDYTVYKR